jgi:hypothetical protein
MDNKYLTSFWSFYHAQNMGKVRLVQMREVCIGQYMVNRALKVSFTTRTRG